MRWFNGVTVEQCLRAKGNTLARRFQLCQLADSLLEVTYVLEKRHCDDPLGLRRRFSGYNQDAVRFEVDLICEVQVCPLCRRQCTS